MKDCIRLCDVSKQYHQCKVVKNISFSIYEGKICAFLGSNGAGKSTTMNMIVTLLHKNSGNIYVNEHEVDCCPELIRREIGVVFQEDVLDLELTVYENLYYRGGLYLNDKKLLKHRIDKIMQQFNIKYLANQKYQTCSGGQKRLVQIARAVIANPNVLILDEPTIGLDPLARDQVWTALQHLNQTNHMTIFYSTHYMEEAALADQICMIDQGQLLLCTGIEQLRIRHKETYQIAHALQTIYIDLLSRHRIVGEECFDETIPVPGRT